MLTRCILLERVYDAPDEENQPRACVSDQVEERVIGMELRRLLLTEGVGRDCFHAGGALDTALVDGEIRRVLRLRHEEVDLLPVNSREIGPKPNTYPHPTTSVVYAGILQSEDPGRGAARKATPGALLATAGGGSVKRDVAKLEQRSIPQDIVLCIGVIGYEHHSLG